MADVGDFLLNKRDDEEKRRELSAKLAKEREQRMEIDRARKLAAEEAKAETSTLRGAAGLQAQGLTERQLLAKDEAEKETAQKQKRAGMIEEAGKTAAAQAAEESLRNLSGVLGPEGTQALVDNMRAAQETASDPLKAAQLGAQAQAIEQGPLPPPLTRGVSGLPFPGGEPQTPQGGGTLVVGQGGGNLAAGLKPGDTITVGPDGEVRRNQILVFDLETRQPGWIPLNEYDPRRFNPLSPDLLAQQPAAEAPAAAGGGGVMARAGEIASSVPSVVGQAMRGAGEAIAPLGNVLTPQGLAAALPSVGMPQLPSGAQMTDTYRQGLQAQQQAEQERIARSGQNIPALARLGGALENMTAFGAAPLNAIGQGIQGARQFLANPGPPPAPPVPPSQLPINRFQPSLPQAGSLARVPLTPPGGPLRPTPWGESLPGRIEQGAANALSGLGSLLTPREAGAAEITGPAASLISPVGTSSGGGRQERLQQLYQRELQSLPPGRVPYSQAAPYFQAGDVDAGLQTLYGPFVNRGLQERLRQLSQPLFGR